MQQQRPQQTPEGRLIADALERSGLTLREAARRTGKPGYGRWRQIMSGVQHVSTGVTAPVRDVPAKTIAKMAHVVGISPEQLESEGQRPDAARELRDLQRQQPAPPPAPSLSVVPRDPPAGLLTLPQMEDAVGEYTAIISRLAQLQRDRGIEPDQARGGDLFPDDAPRGAAWDTAVETLEPLMRMGLPVSWSDAAWATARGIRKHARSEEDARPGRSGIRGA